MRIGSILLLSFLLQAIISIEALAALDEAYGVVTNVLDGDTVDVTIEKADPRIVSGVERVRLADVDSPEMDTADGSRAKDFTYAVLMNKRVFLDIDDRSAYGRDPYGRLVCVVYLTGVYGQPLNVPSFNQLLVSSGHAEVKDFANNEFSPRNWSNQAHSEVSGLEEGSQPGSQTSSLQKQLEGLMNELLGQFKESLARELSQRANETAEWLRQ